MAVVVWRREQEQRARLGAELDRLVGELRRTPGVEQVWLFGSLVDGAPGMTSDLDLLVVQETDLPPIDRSVRLARLLAPTVPVDFFVYTPGEMKPGTRFSRDVQKRGRRIL